VLGGLVTSTLVALFVVPALYPAAGPRPVETDVPKPAVSIGGEAEPVVS
jgi:hypothetical protein